MLTVDEIRNIEFEKSIRGYRPESVHEFLNQIAAQMEKIAAEKEDLEKKLYILAGKVEEYRSEEDMLKTAMINAQRMGENVIREAKQKAENIIREADLKSSLIDEKAREKQQSEEEIYLSLQKKVTLFKSQVLAIYKQHIESLSELPSLDEDENTVEIPVETDEIDTLEQNPKQDEISEDIEIDIEENADHFFEGISLDEPDDQDVEPDLGVVNNFFENKIDTNHIVSEQASEGEFLSFTDEKALNGDDENKEDDLDKLFGLGKSNASKQEVFEEALDESFVEDEEDIKAPVIKSSIFDKFKGIDFND